MCRWEQLERIKASSPSTNILAAPLYGACSVVKSLYFGSIIDDVGYNQVKGDSFLKSQSNWKINIVLFLKNCKIN